MDRKRALSIGYGTAIVTFFAVQLVLGFLLAESDAESVVIITFFAVLPFLNGLLDFASWLFSRWLAGLFLRAIKEEKGRNKLLLRAAVGGAADIAFAVTCLVALAFSLGLAMEVARLQAGWSASVVGPIGQAAADPFGQGLWFTLMLFSTTVPTLLHFALLLSAPLVFAGPPPEKRNRWLAILRQRDFDENNAAHQRVASQAAKWLTGHQDRLAHLGRIAWTLCLGGVVLGLFWLGFEMADSTPADALALVARCGASVGGALNAGTWPQGCLAYEFHWPGV